jgi:hypothetical protein
MTNEYRRELLCVMAHIEQLAAEAEKVSIAVHDDEILLRTSALLAEHRSLLTGVEWKLRSDDQE